jgi:hypothetical protein
MVYGGHLGSVANPDVIWAGIGNQVVYREHRGDPLQAVSGYHGDFVQTVVADPQNYRHIFVVDESSQVWASLDAGHTFLNITANLTQLTPFVTTIELVSTGPALQDKMLVAGGLNGVFALGPTSSGQQPWYRLGDNLPNALVQDLHYDAKAHLLLAGTLGRGAWTLSGSFSGAASGVATSGPNQTGSVAGVSAGNAPAVMVSGGTGNTLPQSLTAPDSGIRGGPARGTATNTSQAGPFAVSSSTTALSGPFAPVGLSGRAVSPADNLPSGPAPAFAGAPPAAEIACQGLLPDRSQQSQLASASSTDAALVDILFQDGPIPEAWFSDWGPGTRSRN